MSNVEIQETKTVYVAWTNSDLTEGRGRSIPYCVAETQETAERLGRKKSVQGSDCHVSPTTAVKVNHTWLIPGIIETETAEDTKRRKRREAGEAAAIKAKAAGLSDEDIAALVGARLYER